MKRIGYLLFFLLLSVTPALAEYTTTLKDPTSLAGINVLGIDSTTGSRKIDIASWTCKRTKNGVASACSGGALTEIDDTDHPGEWFYAPGSNDFDTVGVVWFTFTASGTLPVSVPVQVTKAKGDALLVAESGTTLTLSSLAPVNADDQFNNGFEIIFWNDGYEVARTCIVDSTNSGETVVTEEDVSGNPGVGVGIPYAIRHSAACHLTASKIADKALTEAKFGATRTFGSGSTSTSWVLNASETSADITGQEIVDVASLQSRRCDAYNTSTKTCTVLAGVTPTSGTDYVIKGLYGSVGSGGITAASFAANSITDAAVGSALTVDITGNVTGSVGSVTGNIGGNVNGNLVGTVGGMSAPALDDFFSVVTGATYAGAVSGSVVKEIVDNSGGAGLSVQDIVDGVYDEARSAHNTAGTFGEGVNVAPGGISGASFAANVEGHIGTAQAVGTKTIQIAASENYANNALADHTSVSIVSATTGVGQTRCICGNTQSNDTLSLCQNWGPTPTGTVVYTLRSTPNCNTLKWPQAR